MARFLVDEDLARALAQVAPPVSKPPCYLMSMTPAPRRKSRTAQGPTPARVYAERAHQLPRAPVDGRLGPAVVCDLPPDVQEHILEGIEQAERGEFAELSPEETQHYIQTGGLPPRLEHCVASLTSRPRS